MKTLVFTTAFLLLCAAAVNGYYIPAECVQGIKKFPVPCCPLFQGSPCGCNSGRGNCVAVATSSMETSTYENTDERLNRSAYFNMTCQCTQNFFGYKCHECYFGWKGDRCNIPHKVVRRNIKNMTAAEVQKLIAIFHYCKHKRDPEYVILTNSDCPQFKPYRFLPASFQDIIAFIHYYASKYAVKDGEEVTSVTFAHTSTAFLTWHRLILLLFERSIQRCIKDPNFGIVYWKWEDEPNGTCSICNDDSFGSNDSSGKISPYSIFSEWRLICGLDHSNTVCVTDECLCQRPRLDRMVGLTIAKLPNAAAIQRCLKMKNLDTWPYSQNSKNSFRACLEDEHNAVHLFIGGAMNSTRTAASDYFFFLHHANTDRIMEEYIRCNNLVPDSYPPNTYPGHGPQHCMVPFHYCCKNMEMLTPCHNLGYTYG